MASIGMAMHWANQAYEADRVQREQAERLMATNDLFDSQVRQATLAQETEELAQAESDRVKDALTQRKSQIQRGDKQAYADFLNDTLATEGRGAVLDGDIVYEIDEAGRPIRAIADLQGMSGAQMVAAANQLVPTASQVAESWQSAVSADLQRQFELQQTQLTGENSLAVAALRGQYDLAAANARAAVDSQGNNIALASLYAQRDDALRGQAYSEAVRRINPDYTYTVDQFNIPGVFSLSTGQRVELSPEDLGKVQNDFNQIITTASNVPGQQPLLFTGVGLTNQLAGQQELAAQQQAAAAPLVAATQQAANVIRPVQVSPAQSFPGIGTLMINNTPLFGQGGLLFNGSGSLSPEQITSSEQIAAQQRAASFSPF